MEPNFRADVDGTAHVILSPMQHQEEHHECRRAEQEDVFKDEAEMEPQNLIQDWSWVKDVQPSYEDDIARNGSPLHAKAATKSQPAAATLNDLPDIRPLQPFQLQQLRSTAQSFANVYSKLTPLLDEVMKLRSEGIYERQECSQRRTFLAQSQGDLIKTLFASASTMPVHKTNGSDLEKSHQQVRDDSIAVASQDERALEVETNLLQNEYDLQGKESELAQAVNDFLEVLKKSDILPLEDQRHQPLSPPKLPSPQVPPALEDYYEKVGAVGWKKDRLAELRTEYKETRVARAFRRDHEEALESSDEEFELEFSKKLEDARQAVEKADVEAQNSRAICIKQGLDPDAHKRQRPQETFEISLLPVTPDDEMNELTAARHSPTPVYPSLMSEPNQSSTMLTTITGPMNQDGPPRRRRKREIQRSHSRIKNWIHDQPLEEYPFEDDRFEEYPISRPTSFSRRSFNDLKPPPIIGAEIQERTPLQLREHYLSEPHVSHQKSKGGRFRHSRVVSESDVEEQRQRKDSQQENWPDADRTGHQKENENESGYAKAPGEGTSSVGYVAIVTP